MARILLTGFEPFAGAPSNPSWDAVALAASAWTGPSEVVAARLPVEFAGAARTLAVLVESHRPDAVVAVGVAEGRDAVTPERVAINLADAAIPDNAGSQPVDLAIATDGPAALFSTLPVKAMVAAMHAAGLPARLSTTAGTYVCNHVMYSLLHGLAGHVPVSGFIHVPASPEMGLPGEVPTLAVDRTAAALTACLTALTSHLEARDDAAVEA